MFTSTDAGGTWNVFCLRPKGHAIGLIIVDEARGQSSLTHPAMYLALENEGVFRSTDAGAQWTLLNSGLIDQTITAVAAIETTVFAGTNTGLYRLNSGTWEQLPVATSEVIHMSVIRSAIRSRTSEAESTPWPAADLEPPPPLPNTLGKQ